MSIPIFKVALITSEIDPFSKSGGLGDVTRSLSKALKRWGQQIIVITPLYGKIVNKKKHQLKLVYSNVELIINSQDKVKVNYWKGYLMPDLPIYFVENKKYFSRRRQLYGSAHENARFLVFNVAALKLISLLKFNADILHCHDWQTGLIPYYLRTKFRYSKTLKGAKTVFTIHNLIFQLGHNWWEVPPEKKDYGRSRLPHLDDPNLEYINFAKRAILSADTINTVSEQYRDEILTKNFGQDLHRILRNRQNRLFGIVNGIDYNTFNPANDPHLKANYSFKDFSPKIINKKYIQKKFGFSRSNKIPLLVSTSRITFQKGFEILIKILDKILELNLQYIILGDGDKRYIGIIKKLQKKYHHKLHWLPFTGNEKMETLLYAASDIFLLPSHHEPCGINQLKAMRYGSIPIVRNVGGLHNTVENYHPDNSHSTGFVFHQFDETFLFGAIVRALEIYKHKDIWRQLILNVMQKSNSWEIPARKYIMLYQKTLKLNGKHT